MERNMGRDTPDVSVVMPAYNAEAYIEAAIRSVLQQTFGDWELIVLDDCSTDKTPEIIKKFSKMDDRIRSVHFHTNVGVANTRNSGLDLCRGRYIALLDSDDVWRADKLERQLELAERSKADIIYCSYAIIDEVGQRKCNDFIVPERTDYESMLSKSVISCSTALLSERIVQKYRFSTQFYHEDFVLWLQLLKDGYAACGVQEVLAGYRVKSGSRAANKIHSAMNRWKVYRSYLRLPVMKSFKSIVRYSVAGFKKYQRQSDFDGKMWTEEKSG